MGSSGTLQELSVQLTNSITGGSLTLSSSTISAPTFSWSLQTMGLKSLVLQIPDPATGIVYDEATATLTITGSCVAYTNWNAAVYTIILSSGDAGHTVTYANTNIGATYETFNIQNIAGSGLVPSGSLTAALLPSYLMDNVPMSVISTSASTLPNCTLNFGIAAAEITPPWAIVGSLGLYMTTMGFVVANTMSKTNVISRVFDLSGGVKIGSILVDITVTIPVNTDSQSNIWALSFSSEIGQTGLNIANLVQNLGGINVFQEFPNSLTGIGGFTLTNFYTQFDPSTLTVNQIEINIGAPKWQVTKQFSIENTNFSVQTYNPFNSVSRNTTLSIGGDFQVTSDTQTVATLSAMAILPLGASDWFFNISGEINNVDYSTLVGSTPGFETYKPPSAPNGFELEKIILNYLNISYNPTTGTLTEVSLSVNSILEFPVVPGIIGVADPYFTLNLTNPSSDANYNYEGTVGGTVTLTNAPFLDLEAAVAKETGWVYTAALSEGATINIIDLLDQFFANSSTVPPWVGSELEITALSLVIKTAPSGKTEPPTEYIIGGTVRWKLVVGAFNLPEATAVVEIDYQKPNVSGTITVTTTLFGLDFLIGYKFATGNQTNSQEVFLTWNGITADYQYVENQYSKYSLTVSNLSLGGLITSVMSDIIPGFTLSPPWNLLNDINLNGLSIECTQYVKTADQSKNSLIVKLPINLDLGFINIKNATLTRMGSGSGAQTYLGFEGTFLGFEISSDSPNESAQQLAGTGSPVSNMPSVPGLGGNVFDLQYFGLGQHVALYPTQNLDSVTKAVDALKNVFQDPPKQTPGQPPIIPIPPKPSSPPTESILIFDGTSNWLIGLQCTILNTVKLGVVFNDPNLYGLSVALSGEKAGIFDGLDFEILYKKINDSIGMYQIDLQLPTAMRTLEFGAVSITLPSASIQIYTNGNFMVDLGFPWNNDFSRSFTIQAFPFIGQGGFYFGVLNGATSSNVPKSDVGSFSPVIELGVGLSLGVGKNVDAGILSAGLSVMAVGVFQGVLAQFNTNSPEYWGDGDFYYKATGTFGITGRIYGSVNFAIISAQLDITAYAYVTITIEAYNLIAINFTAGVSVSLRVTVNLGIFKIHITLKFSATVSASFTIGTNNTAKAPWNQPKLNYAARTMSMRSSMFSDAALSYDILWKPLTQTGTKPAINLMYLPLLSVSDATGTNQAQFVNALFIDALDPSDETEKLDSGFTSLTKAVLQWAINAIINSSSQDPTNVDDLMGQPVTLDQLQAIFCYLTYETDNCFPILYSNTWNNKEFDIRAFLENYFTINITAQNIENEEASNATIFPMFPDLILNDNLNGKPGTPVDFSANPQPFSYVDEVQVQLEELAVEYQSAAEAQNDESAADCPTVTDASLPATPPNVSFATFIIQDYFEMIVKNVVQDAIDSFDSYTYTITGTTTLNDVVVTFTATPLNNQLTAVNIVTANPAVNLNETQPFNLVGISYPIAANDTFNSIAALYNTGLQPANHITAAQLGTDSNSVINGLIVLGTVVTVPGFNPYTTIATDTLTSIAAALTPVSGTATASVSDVINAVAGLPVLTTLCVIEIPTLTYTTGATDTFASIATVYGVTTDVLAAGNPNVTFNATTLIVPGITTLLVEDVVEQVIVVKNINSYSGMTSRFLLHGLNLPDPNDMNEVKPLYVLTGQQLTVPPLKQGDAYNLQLTPGANGSWINLAANPLSLPVDNNEISRIADVLTFTDLTQSTTAQPPAPLQLYMDAYVAYTLRSQIPWQYPGALTLPVGTAPAQVVGTPSLWYFPDSLTGALQDTKQDLELELLVQTLNSDGKTYTQSSVTNYGWSTLINIGVEKITDSNEQAPVFANTYNLSGASGGDIVYLERLVAALNSGNGPKIDQIRILFDPNASGNASTTGVQSISDGAYEIGVVKINLSTETHPEVSLRMALATEETGYSAPDPNTLNSFPDFLSYVWECSIVRSGGFYLYFNQNDGGAGLPDSLFSTNPMANLYLLVTYQGEATGDYMNAVAVGDPINIDTSVLFVQSDALKTRNAVMSPGNGGFQLTIDNPGPYDPINPYPIPATPASHTSDQLFLQNQFNLIGYQLLKNDAFTGSPESLMPVGPLTSSNPGDPESENEKDTDTDNWPYQGTLPLATYAVSKINPTDPSYPPASGDPYSGNGESALIQLSLVDLFGNPINSNISGEDGLITIDLAYTDNIIPLSQWPGVTPRYSFTGTSDKPSLKVDLCFDTSRYEPSDDKTDTGGPSPKDLALADMGTYASIYYQLIQPDVVVSYRTSLYTSETYPEGVPLTPDSVISDYVGTIYAYLSNIANGTPQTATVPVPWSISSEVTASNLDNIYELITDLTIQRTSNISPDFKDVAAVSSVTTLIQPITQELCTSDSSTSATLTYFATGFEQVFSSTQIPGAYMKVASGVNSENVSSNGDSQKVWVVRFDPTGEYGINVAFNQADKEPVSYYYSPGPLSTSLQTLNNVPITPYVTGQEFSYNPASPTKNFSTVDMDQWALVCLQAIDNFLSPQYSVPAFLLDNGVTLQSVLDAKENLANYITGTVTNVLDQPLTEAQITNAQEVFNQQLLISLGNAYNISTIIQHPVTVGSEYTGSNVAPNNTEPINPRFYGAMYGIDPQPVGNYGSADASSQYSFTNTKIPLGEGASWVNYCLYVKDAAQVESFKFSQLNFVLSNIEHQIENIPNVEGYQASTWLNFVIPLPNDQFNTGGTVDIPVPLRAYPIPPSVNSQSASYDQNNVTGETTTIDAALEWGFNFQYSQQEATQDMINAQVAFNSSIPLMATPPIDQSISLVDALAQFISVLPALTTDFLDYVAVLTPKDVAANNTVATNAKAAVQSLANLSDLVATGWSTYNQYNPWPPVAEDYGNLKMAVTPEASGVILNYTIDETESEQGNPDSAMTLTITADSGNPPNIALPMASIEGYTTITISETSDSVSYQFQDSDKNPLSYANRQVVNTRSLEFTPLDLMEYQEGWAGLQITRNQNLVPEFETNSLFLYQTPLVKFYTPLTPLLTANALIDISAINASGKPEVNYLAVQLQNLFNAIFDVYQLGNPTIRLEALYSYNLSGEASWNQIHLPVFLALPFVLDLSTDLNIGSEPPYCTTTESFVCTVSKTLLDWYDTVKPSPTNGQFTFKLIIYSASDNTTPLVSLTDLSLSITEITELS